MEKFVELLGKALEKLGLAAEYAWPLVVKAYAVEVITELLVALVSAAAAGLIGYRCFRASLASHVRHRQEEAALGRQMFDPRAETVIPAVASMVCLVIVIISMAHVLTHLGEAAALIASPEGAYIRQIMKGGR